MNRPFGLPNPRWIDETKRRYAQGYLPRGYIDGLVLSNDGTDATNDIVIAPGVARSTVNVVDGVASTLARDQIDMELPVSLIKQLDVAWAPDNYDADGFSGGTRTGGRIGSIGNATWHVYLVGAADRQPGVMLYDTAVQATVLAALPGGYTAYRRIGSVIRESAALVTFVQHGELFQRKVAIVTSQANPGTSANTATLAVPTGINIIARINASLVFNATPADVLFSDLDFTDAAASSTAAPLASFTSRDGGGIWTHGPVDIRTNTSAQIRYRLNGSDGNSIIRIATLGWLDQRGRNE